MNWQGEMHVLVGFKNKFHTCSLHPVPLGTQNTGMVQLVDMVMPFWPISCIHESKECSLGQTLQCIAL